MSAGAKTRYVVFCTRHGVESKDWSGKQIVVSVPKSRKQRRDAGCPRCAAELQDTANKEAA